MEIEKKNSLPIGGEEFLQFLHHTHIYASMVRDVLEGKYLREATELDITVPQFYLLRLIDHEGSHQISEIASFLGMSQAAASKNVDKLVRLQLVSRETQEKDRRAVSLNLTSGGKSILQNYEALKEGRLKKLLEENFAADELTSLVHGLEKVSRLILEKEVDDHICMKCSAYYVKNCLFNSKRKDCLYQKKRKCPSSPSVPSVDGRGGSAPRVSSAFLAR